MLSQGLSPNAFREKGAASRYAAILVKNPWAQENPVVGVCKKGAHVLDQIRAIAATQPIGTMLAPAADIGRRSWPMSTLPQLERVGHDWVHFVAVAQRTARIRHDEIAFAQPFADLDIHVRMKTDLHDPRLDDV